ncbi:MAG: hypothetical protein PVG85_02830, partial [Deltaproteobacteria bacterium]
MSNALWTILDHVRIQDLLEIVIISALIYVILVWFEKAASQFVLVGIGLLGAVYMLLRVFELHLTAVVLQAFFAVLLVALVVIFQEELRRFFERPAIWAKIRNRSHEPARHIVVDVGHQFGKKACGVLIEVQGGDPLARHIGLETCRPCVCLGGIGFSLCQFRLCQQIFIPKFQEELSCLH